MSPPPYADLGKAARDLFSKGYNVGFLKVQSKTRPHKDGEFTLTGDHNMHTGILAGNFELKYKLPDYGVTLTEKWTTDNVISTEVQATDPGVKGTKMTLFTDFSPVTKTRNAKLKGEFAQDSAHLSADLSVAGAPLVNAAAVFNYQNILVGVQGGYSVEKAAVTQTNVALGYVSNNYVLHASINDQTFFNGSLYQKVNDKMEIGVNAGWKQGDPMPQFGLATQYKMDKDWTVRAKALHVGQLHVASSHQLNPHFKLILSTGIEMKNFKEGGHKFGMGIEYEPL